MTVRFGNQGCLKHNFMIFWDKWPASLSLEDLANLVMRGRCPCCGGAEPKLSMKTIHMLGSSSDMRLKTDYYHITELSKSGNNPPKTCV